MKYLQISIKFLLFLTTLTPLILTRNIIFPFIFGKMVFFRGIVELALILFLVYLIYSFYKNNWKLFKNPLFILILLFFISLIVSTVFAVNPYRAFWGDTERAEGLFGMFHYLAFLIMTILVFEKKDWLKFFKISLFVGLITIFYGLLQYFGIREFPFLALSPSPRPGSYIGNPAFLATYMFFIIAFATIILFKTYKLKFWRYFSLMMIVLAIAMIFITATRGAILGLGVGIFTLLIYFILKRQSISINLYKSLSISLRKLSLFLLLLIIIFGSIFWFTRSAEIWQKVPGLNRLAQTATFDVNDASTQMRLMNWRISWEAFKEKPFFGWGPENYLLAYQSSYNPDMALYGETWLDRAHNKIIDIGVMQGIFGLFTYLLMFGGIFYLLFKEKGTAAPFLIAILIAYFVQNLVLFDQIVSYIPFFAVLGFLISISTKEDLISDQHQSLIVKNRLLKVISFAIIAAVIAGLSYTLYFYNYIPYVQAKTFKEASELRRAGDLADLTMDDFIDLIAKTINRAMYPYNFAQYNIRGQGVDAYYLNQFFYQIELIENPQFEPLADLLIKGQEEIIEKEPYDVRLFIREVEMLNPKAANNHPELYKKTESLIRQALEIAPKRQELHYNLAFSLAGQERSEEAIEISRYALSLSPDVARAHYHLGLILAITGKDNEEAAKELAIAEKLEPDFKNFLPGDLNNIALIYTNWGRIDKVAELIIKSLDGKIELMGFGFKREYYEIALRYYAIIHDSKNLVKVASYLTRFNDIKDTMEVLIDLAEKENWEIIDKL